MALLNLRGLARSRLETPQRVVTRTRPARPQHRVGFVEEVKRADGMADTHPFDGELMLYLGDANHFLS